ncbi:MAG: acetate--CoA ligase [Persicimonas sp.]
MDYPVIPKSSPPGGVEPNLSDYERARESFDWEQARAQLDGLPDGAGLNIAHEAVDRHARGALAEKVAIRWLAADGRIEDITYTELAERTARFANALEGLGVGKGDRVFVMASRIPELYVAMLGSLKARAVVSPLFSAFGPEPILQRAGSAEPRVLVTTAKLYREKIAPIRDQIPSLEHVIVAGEADGLVADETIEAGEGVEGFDALLEAAAPHYEIGPTDPEDMALLHFTSGTTGMPKGAIHVHEAVVAHHVTGQFALDFHRDDVFWCTADPGWVTGTSYGIISPLTNGLTMVVDEAEFRAERWYQTLQDQKITNWYTAPTAIRMLMKAGADRAEAYDLSNLRFIASVGEPLNPEAVVWATKAYGMPIHDNWWQTETGGIMVANFASADIKPGSMGRPMPGIEASVVRVDDGGDGSGELEHLEEPGAEGELALRAGWPSMFRGYLHMEQRYEDSFVGGWYLSGDIAQRDEDGYFWFVGRADDLIKSAGHLIGPFEVESALLAHPAVAEAGVIGKPHDVAGQIVKAFVTLRAGYTPDDELRRELRGFARKRLGPAVAPRELDFVDDLPKTRSGKIMRRLLKARELGLPEGDTSTLESSDG